MKVIISIAAGAALTMSSAASAQATCPTWTPGQLYPWESHELVSGDQYAWVYLLINNRGHATDCRIGETNMHDHDTRGILCMSFQKNWYMNPIIGDNGKPVTGWFKRYFISLGTKHQQKDLEARKLFFQQHLEERPQCYPEYTR
jgi:hypothetical protein